MAKRMSVRDTASLGAIWAILKAVEHSESPGLIVSSNQNSLMETQACLAELLDVLGIDYVIGKKPLKAWGVEVRYANYSNLMVLENGAHIHLRTDGKGSPANLIGVSAGWVWVNGSIKTETVDVIRGCLRQEPGEWKQTW